MLNALRKVATPPADQVAGGFGVQPAATTPAPPPVPKAARMSPADARRLMDAELMAALREITETTTRLTAALRGGILNGVLDVWMGIIPAAGYIEKTYGVPIGSVGVINHGTTAIIVKSGQAGGAGAAATVPSTGQGMNRIEPSSFLCMPIADRSFAILGAAGQQVSVQVYTGLQPWGAGPV